MMTRWLPEDEEDKLPPGASHQVGVGAFVLNAERQVLVVQARVHPFLPVCMPPPALPLT